MKYCLILISLFLALPVFAEDLKIDRAQKCRMQRYSKAPMYIEDMEYCSNLLLSESLKEFNLFAEKRAPAVDCQEAKENPKLVNDCRAVGIKKVKMQAKALGVTVRDQDVYACDVDDRFYNPWKYVWYCADTPRGKISQLTQKPLFKDCF